MRETTGARGSYRENRRRGEWDGTVHHTGYRLYTGSETVLFFNKHFVDEMNKGLLIDSVSQPTWEFYKS